MDEQRDSEAQGQTTADDAADVALVAQLVARAGLRLTTAEIGELVAAYRYDRAGFARMRTMLVAEDETAHAFQVTRVMRPASERRAGDADAATDR
ncbi:MAG: hypothetical protein M3O34_09510 [Chloroflexota bacterium]|nr:hypothetical protein [Chloroflexota bacterium]